MTTLNTIKDAAVERTGLKRFGDDSFEEELSILLTSLRDEARLNARGEAYYLRPHHRIPRRPADVQCGLHLHRRRRSDPRRAVQAPWLTRPQALGEDMLERSNPLEKTDVGDRRGD